MGEYISKNKNENRAYLKNSVEVNEKKKKRGLGRKGIKGDWRARYRRSFEIRIAKGKRGRATPAVPEMNSPFTV